MLDKADDAMEDRVEELWRRFGLQNSVPVSSLPTDAKAEPTPEIPDVDTKIKSEPKFSSVEDTGPDLTVKASLEQSDAWETQRQFSEELAEVREIRAQLEQQRDQIYSEVTERVQGIVESAIVRAQAEIADLKRHAIDEIKIVLQRIETLQSEVFEELKIQRILNDVDQLKATSEWMNTSESSPFPNDKVEI